MASSTCEATWTGAQGGSSSGALATAPIRVAAGGPVVCDASRPWVHRIHDRQGDVVDKRAQGGTEAYDCERCGEAFPTQEKLDRHVHERHADVQDLEVPPGTGGSRTDGGAGMVQTE